MSAPSSRPLSLPAHVPALDGLRGVAVLLVIAYHALGELNTRWVATVFQAGWAGVDLFFVLSGFLITRILLQTRESASYFRTFYLRRALRIWPLYFAVLAFVFVAMGPLLPPLAFDSAQYPWPVYALYIQNLWLEDFGPPPLNVTWSLAIEEQFYLVWPLLVFLLKPRWLRTVLGAWVLLSPVARCAALLEGLAPFHVYTATLFRLDGLALGGLLALGVVEGRHTVEQLERWGRRLAVPALLVAFGLVLVFFDGRYALHKAEALAGLGGPTLRAVLVAGVYTLWAVGFASLLALALTGRARVLDAVLRWRPLRWLGQVSYGLYLFHALIFAVGSHYLRPAFQRVIPSSVVATAVSLVFECVLLLVLTAVSWRFFEQPLLRLKDRIAPAGSPGVKPGLA